MKIINKALAICLVILFYGTITSTSVLAAEAGGGQVSTNSKIVFYEDDVKPTPKPAPTPTPKPKPGILPQTGEQVGYYSIGGLAVLLMVIALIVWKRRRKEYEK